MAYNKYHIIHKSFARSIFDLFEETHYKVYYLHIETKQSRKRQTVNR